MRGRPERPSLQPILWATFWVALLFNAPTWWQRAGRTYEGLNPGWRVAGAVAEAALVLAVTALLLLMAAWLGRWVWRLVASALLVVSAVCAYYMSAFNVLIGYGAMLAVFTADHDMSSEVMGWKMAVWVLLLGLLPLWWLWRRPAPASLRTWWRQPRAAGLQLGLLAVCALLFVGGQKTLKQVSPMVRNADTDVVTNLAGVVAHSYVPTNWISGTGMVGANAWAARSGAQKLRAPARMFRYEEGAPLDDVHLVVVIGETARHDHMGALGYTRDTTPLMASAAGHAAFRATSCDTSTKLSISCMFVRPEGITLGEGLQPDVVNEETVFSVLKALNFQVEIYALQSEVGLYQRMRPDSYKMREMIFADPRHANSARNDLLLVDELKDALARRAGKGRLATVLHLKGSHFLYTQRYPREFARWQPECPSVDARCSREQLINAYDNSILFTDHVLAQLREALQPHKALLVYSSDHGESIDEGTHFHATPKAVAPPEQRRVPLVWWASDRLRADARLAPGLQRLGERAATDADGRTSHGNLFASILGCLGVRSPDGGITPAHNLCH